MTDAAGTDAQVEIAKRVKVDQSTVSRWKVTDSGGKPENVRKVAEAYGRPVLEAFVAAGFLNAAEARARITAAPDFSQLTNDELLKLVRARMTEGSGEHVDGSATNTDAGERRLSAVAGTGATPEQAKQASKRAAKSKADQQAAIDEMERKKGDKKD